MTKNERDTFEIHSHTTKENSGDKIIKSAEKKNSSNFFLSEDIPALKSSAEPLRRINDYDLNLLEEDAYKEVSDDIFKLEYKISKIEDEIANVENQIQSAEAINDAPLIINLKERLVTLQDEYDSMLAAYNEKSVSAKITGCISSIFVDKIKNTLRRLRNKFLNLYNVIIPKMPQKFTSVIELKDSLTKLQNINKSVDTLINLNTPYGENTDKYDKISKYIIKANSIHSNITKKIK